MLRVYMTHPRSVNLISSRAKLRRIGLRFWHSPTLTTWGSLSTRLLGFSVLLPLILNRLPVAEASLWLLFSTVVGLLTLADFGFAPTFTRAVAYANASSNIDAQQLDTTSNIKISINASPSITLIPVIHTMRYIYDRVGILALLLASTLGSLAMIRPISQMIDPTQGWLAWVAIVVGVASSLRGGMFGAYLQGSENISIYRRWEILIGTLSLATTLIVLLMGYGLLGLVLTTQAGILSNVIINRWLAIQLAPTDAWTKRVRLDSAVLSNIWSPAWRSGLGVLMTSGSIHGASVIYAQIAPPSHVAAYLLAQRIMQTLTSFANVPFYTRIPTLARLYAQGQIHTIIRIAKIGMQRANWLLVISIIAINFGAIFLLKIVGSKVAFIDNDVWLLMGLAFLFERIGAMHLQLYSITNCIVWHIANGVAGLIILVAIPISYNMFGIIGLPMGILMAYGFFYVPYSIKHSYQTFHLKLSTMDTAASILPVGVLLVILLITR